MMVISIRGEYLEVEHNQIRGFHRTFVLVSRGSGPRIINDQLHVGSHVRPHAVMPTATSPSAAPSLGALLSGTATPPPPQQVQMLALSPQQQQQQQMWAVQLGQALQRRPEDIYSLLCRTGWPPTIEQAHALVLQQMR
jgi:hypothetical protein